MEEAAVELTRMIVMLEESTLVRSLFHVADECAMDYSWGWRVLRHAEALGFVKVERNGPGTPLKIESTERGRARVMELTGVFARKWEPAPL